MGNVDEGSADRVLSLGQRKGRRKNAKHIFLIQGNEPQGRRNFGKRSCDFHRMIEITPVR